MSLKFYDWMLDDNVDHPLADASHSPQLTSNEWVEFCRSSPDAVQPPPGLNCFQPRSTVGRITPPLVSEHFTPTQKSEDIHTDKYSPLPSWLDSALQSQSLEDMESASDGITPPPGLEYFPPLLDLEDTNSKLFCITPPPGLEYLQPAKASEFAHRPSGYITPPPGLGYFQSSQENVRPKVNDRTYAPPGFENVIPKSIASKMINPTTNPPPGLEHVNPNGYVNFDRNQAPPGLEHVLPIPFDSTKIDAKTTPPPGLKHVIPDPFGVFCIEAATRQQFFDNNPRLMFPSDVAEIRNQDGLYPEQATLPPSYPNILRRPYAF